SAVLLGGPSRAAGLRPSAADLAAVRQAARPDGGSGTTRGAAGAGLALVHVRADLIPRGWTPDRPVRDSSDARNSRPTPLCWARHGRRPVLVLPRWPSSLRSSRCEALGALHRPNRTR